MSIWDYVQLYEAHHPPLVGRQVVLPLLTSAGATQQVYPPPQVSTFFLQLLQLGTVEAEAQYEALWFGRQAALPLETSAGATQQTQLLAQVLDPRVQVLQLGMRGCDCSTLMQLLPAR